MLVFVKRRKKKANLLKSPILARIRPTRLKMKAKRTSYFIPFKKEVKLNDADGNSAIVRMLKGGFVSKHASGLYTWFNLGLRMLEKISRIIEEEHEKIGAVKILMPILQDAQLWKDSNRYEPYGDEMLKIFDRKKREFVYGPSAEEMCTSLLTQWSLNKNSFPMILYNIQWKFRDEIRPRFGVVRSREFLMKDAYSFNKTTECLMNTYEKMFNAYSKIFARLGLDVCTFSSDVGLMGGYLSHEFLVKSEFGETLINYDKWPKQPIEWQERDNATLDESEYNEATHESKEKYAEIGHIYALGRRYTECFNLLSPETKEPLEMGCFGIGVSRLVGVIFENGIHDLGIVAPFKYTVVTLQNDEQCINIGRKIFESVDEVLWDDRDDISIGVKFAEAELVGSPIQIYIGKKDLENGEITIKQKGQKMQLPLSQLDKFLAENK